jgi:uncharacterized damage-inducible protein DinB
MFLIAVVSAAALGAAIVQAQAPSGAAANPMSAGSRTMFQIVSGYVTKSAEKASEEIYAFRPTPDVRTFGQIIGHVAEDHFVICAAALGEKPPVEGIEKSKTTKTELVKALADSVAYCQKAYTALTDASGAEVLPFFGQKMARLTILDFNSAHDYEHYGNLVTYMRLKGMVPPSSERQPGR